MDWNTPHSRNGWDLPSATVTAETVIPHISMSFTDLPQKSKERALNNIVSSVCSAYCCRDNCNGCFIQELTDATLPQK